MGDWTLHHGDCLEVMATLPAASVDAVIADPPYGTTACKWDSVIPLAPMWAALKRVIKPRGAIVLFAAQPFTSVLVMSNADWFKYTWVWEKQNPTGFLDARRKPMRAHEDILCFGDGTITYNPQGLKHVSDQFGGRRNKAGNGCYNNVKFHSEASTVGNFPRSVIRFDRLTHQQMHPTQKPVDLLRYLVRTYTDAGQTVLDFTMGSGTTGVACVLEGRTFIGIELERQYYDIAERRISDAAMQQPLFSMAAD